MKSNYEYYKKNIKPLEKKYTRMCILYSIFKFKYFKNKMNFYNIILINYYRTLQDDDKTISEIIKYL